jgi:hypothetical protein
MTASHGETKASTFAGITTPPTGEGQKVTVRDGAPSWIIVIVI